MGYWPTALPTKSSEVLTFSGAGAMATQHGGGCMSLQLSRASCSSKPVCVCAHLLGLQKFGLT